MSNAVRLTFPMHQHGHLVSLEEVLSAIDGAGLVWRLSWLQAVYQKDPGFNVLELEARSRDPHGGVLLTDRELRVLARDLVQVIDGEFRGFTEGSRDDPDGASQIDIIAFDSSEWTIRVPEASTPRVDLGAEFLQGR